MGYAACLSRQSAYLCIMESDILVINGNDALKAYGVRPGKGFIDVLEAPLELKDAIENEDRREDGVRMIVRKTFKKRTITLKFRIHGNTQYEYLQNKAKFEAELYKGIIYLKFNNRSGYYHLVYTGKSVSYTHSYNGVFGEVSMQFIEPDPANRTRTPNPNVVTVTIKEQE